MSLASARERRYSRFRHSSRNLPLKDSSAPFCQGLPGSLSAVCMPSSASFLQYLLTKGYARKTFNRHRDHLWMLGGELVRHHYLDSDSARLDARALILDQIHEFGGPLISKHLSESKQTAFDGTESAKSSAVPYQHRQSIIAQIAHRFRHRPQNLRCVTRAEILEPPMHLAACFI